MEGKAISRKLMLAAGILAALVILFSQTFKPETTCFLSGLKEAKKTEKKAEPEKDVIIAAPTEAVTSGQAVEINDVDPAVIREIMPEETRNTGLRDVFKSFASDLIKTLFRVYISPQAP